MPRSPFQQDWNLSDWSFPPPPQTFASPPSDTECACPIFDLSRQLSAHTLDTLPSPPRELTASPCQTDQSSRQASHDSAFSSSYASSRQSTNTEYPHEEDLSSTSFDPQAYLECTSANIRRQRQRTVREQCSASHLEAISALVARMINNKDQCDVSSPGTGSVDEEDLPLSLARTSSESQTSTRSGRTGSVVSSYTPAGRRSLENRVRKSGRPRSGAFSLSKRL